MKYRGHRASSFYAIDEAELVEIRARQRTFDGAVYRTAMGNLSYAVVVLKLFDQRFFRSMSTLCVYGERVPLLTHIASVGILYTVLSVLLFLLEFSRSRHLNHDFSDSHRPTDVCSDRRVFGREFVTAGWIVLAVSVVVAVVEAVLLALVLTI